MKDYQERMKEEYKDLKDRYIKLSKIIIKAEKGELDFELSCPIILLKQQRNAMKRHLDILEKRAIIEGIEL